MRRRELALTLRIAEPEQVVQVSAEITRRRHAGGQQRLGGGGHDLLFDSGFGELALPAGVVVVARGAEVNVSVDETGQHCHAGCVDFADSLRDACVAGLAYPQDVAIPDQQRRIGYGRMSGAVDQRPSHQCEVVARQRDPGESGERHQQQQHCESTHGGALRWNGRATQRGLRGGL